MGLQNKFEERVFPVTSNPGIDQTVLTPAGNLVSFTALNTFELTDIAEALKRVVLTSKDDSTCGYLPADLTDDAATPHLVEEAAYDLAKLRFTISSAPLYSNLIPSRFSSPRSP